MGSTAHKSCSDLACVDHLSQGTWLVWITCPRGPGQVTDCTGLDSSCNKPLFESSNDVM